MENECRREQATPNVIDLTMPPPSKKTYVDKKGYIRFRDSHRFVHRWVAEKHILGRKLKPGEVVHHRDGNPTNSDVDNLEVMTEREHNELHEQKSPGWGERHGVEVSGDKERQGCALFLLGIITIVCVASVLLWTAMTL